MLFPGTPGSCSSVLTPPRCYLLRGVLFAPHQLRYPFPSPCLHYCLVISAGPTSIQSGLGCLFAHSCIWLEASCESCLPEVSLKPQTVTNNKCRVDTLITSFSFLETAGRLGSGSTRVPQNARDNFRTQWSHSPHNDTSVSSGACVEAIAW